MDSKEQSVGIIGFGAFGRFMAKHLSPWFGAVKVWDCAPKAIDGAEDIGIAEFCELRDVGGCDVVIFGVPWDSLEEAVLAAREYIRPGTLVMDVTSVKMGPAQTLPRLLPDNVEILCTHPTFGPQSGKNGIAGLLIALCPIRIEPERYYRVCDFLTDNLSLLVLKTTPEKHDREMARVQAVSHFMSRALKEIGLAPSLMATKAYEKLQEFSAIVLSDSWDLFLTIQNGNPFAKEVRENLMKEMVSLESKINEGRKNRV